MSDVIVRVGVAVDRDPMKAFQPIVTAARRARREIERALQGSGKIDMKMTQTVAETVKLGDSLTAATGKMSALANEAARVQREMYSAARAPAMLGRGGGGGHGGGFGGGGWSGGGGNWGGGFGYRVGYWAQRNVFPITPMLSYGTRFASDIMRGAGVRLNPADYVASYTDLTGRAATLSNNAYMPGQGGPAGQRQDPRALMRLASDVAIAHGTTQDVAMSGLEAFVAKTGDLESGRAILQDMARLSTATGASLDDMADAAGDVANALGNVADKPKVMQGVMQAIAGQGKLGAVEIRQLSSQMAKVASAAPSFAGDAATNIVKMGALAQMTRAYGGAASATQAATSVASFTSMLKTPARVKEIEGVLGRGAIYDKAGMLKAPEEIILAALAAAGNDPKKFKNMFANMQGGRVTEGFANVYRTAGGGQAGLDAVRAEFDKFMRATMSATEVVESHDAAMKSDAKQIAVVNARLQEIANDTSRDLLPSIQLLAPRLTSLASTIGGATKWAAQNPGLALATAGGIGVGKAAIEQTMRVGLEHIVKRSAYGAMGLGGTLGAAATLTALSVATIEVGKLVVDNVLNEKAKSEDRRIASDLSAGNIEAKLVKARREGKVTPELIAEAKEAAAKLDAARVSGAKGDGLIANFIRDFASTVDPEASRLAAKEAARNTEQMAAMTKQLESLATAITGATNGTVKVQITNIPGSNAPVVSDGARMPDVGYSGKL